MSQWKTLVFSHKRALQLDAFINSYFFNCEDSESLQIYDKDCSKLTPGKFKQDVIDAIGDYEYVLFCVDDLIFKEPFSLCDIMRALSRFKKAIGFSLCLGTNTDYCYMKDCKQEIPAWSPEKNIFVYQWTEATLDFAYSMALSGHAYRTGDVLPIIKDGDFDCPNSLEVALYRKRYIPKKNSMLAYRKSVAFCAPFNKVQTKFPNNRSMFYIPEFFDRLYENGKRIDWMKYQGIKTNAVHQEVDLYLKGE